MKVILAGGGTGGHVFPALAVARALETLGAKPHFVGAARGLEATAVPKAGYPLTLLPLEPMKGGGVRRAMRGGVIAATGVAAATRLLRRERPSVVLGVGGYAAGPACLAAAVLGIPMAVLEPNAVPGFTNRMLMPFAARAYVAWGEAGRKFKTFRVLGVPVRAGFLVAPYEPSPPHRIVVLGGSQGAQSLNRGLPAAFGALQRQGHTLSVIHQTGKHSVEEVESAYRAQGVEARVTSFLEDVPGAFAAASLVVARGGASTVAEILASGRPSVLVPFPFAADDHQTANARLVEQSRAGLHVAEAELEARIVTVLGNLLGDPARLSAMATAAAAHGRPDAAATIARDLLDLPFSTAPRR